MFANELKELVDNNITQIRSIKGYDKRVSFIVDLVVRYNEEYQIARIRLAARASLQAMMQFPLLEKESSIIITALRLRQEENSFVYAEDGFTPEMLEDCRIVFAYIKKICEE